MIAGKMMKSIHIGSAALLLALCACSKPNGTIEEQTSSLQAGNTQATAESIDAGKMIPAERAARANAAKVGDDAPYYMALKLNEFMPHVMQYAGDGIWKRQGYIVDKDGEHSLFPKNEQEWEDAESAARTLVEVTNVLLIPGRRVPDPEWDKAVLAVRTVALRAAAAAEKKNADAWFIAGGDLDEACDECHKRFDPTFQGPPTTK
jgi:hypothetical protein